MAGLYVHIPFCRAKCPYCDFISGPASEDLQDRYVHSLLEEMRRMASETDRAVAYDTLFLGGGTPTILAIRHLRDIVESALRLFRWVGGPLEVTVEANPETASLPLLKALRQAGVNRLSLGAQSLCAEGLEALGRRHGVGDVVQAYAAARQAGFTNIGLDLIYGWPGQHLAGWIRELEEAAALGPEHLSCYELTLEAGTPMEAWVTQGRVCLPDEDTRLRLTDITEDLLAASGYPQYEISNFALPGRECRHNMHYWENDAYLGLGCAAVSYDPPRRRGNTRDLAGYVTGMEQEGGEIVAWQEVLDPEARFREAVILGLRMTDGLDAQKMRARWGYDLKAYYGEALSRLVFQGLTQWTHERLRLTRQGRRLANVVFQRLV